MAETTIPPFGETDQPLETIHSDFEVVGSLIGKQDLWESQRFQGAAWTVTTLFDEADQPVGNRVTLIKGDTSTDRTKAEVLGLVLPNMQLVYADYKKVRQYNLSALRMTIQDELCEPNYNVQMPGLDNRVPHTDFGQYFYLAAIGPQPKYWRADFLIPGRGSAEDPDSYIAEQIRQASIEPASPLDGEIARLTDQTVHNNPGNDPEYTGQRRLIMRFEPLRAEDTLIFLPKE